ncbi:ATP-binding protein [Roseovarius sp.]|uniref:ATP-binding protein n=1 Tax=Roseovarius sp. TaxID=1486281 RepID=UPI00356B37B8
MNSKVSKALARAFEIELAKGIPDPGHLELAARCNGDVRQRAFDAAAQVLRVIAGFPAGSVRVGLYLQLDPSRPREKRTRVRLVGHCRDPQDKATASALSLLVRAGPLQGVYADTLQAVETPSHVGGTADKKNQKDKDDWLGVDKYLYCQRILRRESFQSVGAEARQFNHRLAGMRAYMAAHPFEPRSDNDWLELDRLFDQLTEPAMVEVLVGPHDADALREAHFDYSHRLAQINAFDSPLDRQFAEDVRRTVLDKLQHDPQADHFAQLNEEMADHLRQPQLMFTLRCWSASPVESRLLASLVAEQCFEKGSYQFGPVIGDADSIGIAREAAQAMKIRRIRGREQVAEGELAARFSALNQLPTVCTAEEFASVFRLPVARPASAPRTLSLHTDPKPSPTDTWKHGKPSKYTSLLVGEDLEVGPKTLEDELLRSMPLDRLFGDPEGARAEIRLQRDHLQKHLFVCGVPGSGKTTAMFNLVAQLHYQGTPFLVIEPAKTEYRMFKKFRDHPDPSIRDLAERLRVYTLGDERACPLRFNPLVRVEGVSLEEHMGALMTCFKSAMPISGDGPLESLLQESLETVLTNPPKHRQPRLSDLVKTAEQVIKSKGYDSEISGNLRGALDVRLGLLTRGSVGRMLECDESIPSREELFSNPVVLEMDSLTQSHACLLTLLILNALRQHLRVRNRSGTALEHVVFLEEAHNIVGRGSDGGDRSDPRLHAAEYVVRMLAEVRALGEGMVIADQLPSAVAPEVIKNTGNKLALRLVANDDREELGGTMLLDETGIAELARCTVGTGFFYREGFYRPRRVHTVNSHALLGACRKKGSVVEFEPPDRQGLLDLIGDEPWFRESSARRAMQHAIQELQAMENRLSERYALLKSDGAQVLAARTRYFNELGAVPLRSLHATVEDGREALKNSAELMQSAVATIVEVLQHWGADDAWPLDCTRLVHQCRRVFAAGVLPVSTELEKLRLLCASAAAMLTEPDEASMQEPAWLNIEKPPTLRTHVRALTMEVLAEQTDSLRDEFDKLESLERLEPIGIPDEPKEFDEEELNDYYRALKSSAAKSLQSCDVLAEQARELTVGVLLASSATNPFVALDPDAPKSFDPMCRAFSDPRDQACGQHEVLCSELQLQVSRIRDILTATGQLEDGLSATS